LHAPDLGILRKIVGGVRGGVSSGKSQIKDSGLKRDGGLLSPPPIGMCSHWAKASLGDAKGLDDLGSTLPGIPEFLPSCVSEMRGIVVDLILTALFVYKYLNSS
jgi:hypothetical protein